jgi:hypothetical protein
MFKRCGFGAGGTAVWFCAFAAVGCGDDGAMSSTNLLAGAPATPPLAGAGVAAGSGGVGVTGSSGVGQGVAGAPGTVANRGRAGGVPREGCSEDWPSPLRHRSCTHGN